MDKIVTAQQSKKRWERWGGGTTKLFSFYQGPGRFDDSQGMKPMAQTHIHHYRL